MHASAASRRGAALARPASRCYYTELVWVKQTRTCYVLGSRAPREACDGTIDAGACKSNRVFGLPQTRLNAA